MAAAASSGDLGSAAAQATAAAVEANSFAVAADESRLAAADSTAAAPNGHTAHADTLDVSSPLLIILVFIMDAYDARRISKARSSLPCHVPVSLSFRCWWSMACVNFSVLVEQCA